MKLLKQKGSGEIYIWTEDLAKRDDMEEFTRAVVPTIVIPPEPAPKQPEEVQDVVKEVAEVKPVAKKKGK